MLKIASERTDYRRASFSNAVSDKYLMRDTERLFSKVQLVCTKSLQLILQQSFTIYLQKRLYKIYRIQLVPCLYYRHEAKITSKRINWIIKKSLNQKDCMLVSSFYCEWIFWRNVIISWILHSRFPFLLLFLDSVTTYSVPG